MLKLELDDREQEMLSEVLRSFLSELRNEVVHTDQQAYRQRLRDEEKSIKRILSRLELSAAGSSAGQQGMAAM